jgi:hypothetical protein
MVDEPHEVVKLLLKRMESHPEEFNMENGRWAQWLDQLVPFVTEAELRLLREPMMRDIHEEVLDELCNGEERRRKHKEDTEYERHLAQAMRHTQQQALAQQQKAYVGQIQGMAGQVYGGGGGAGLAQGTVSPYAAGAYDFDRDKYRNTPTGHLPVANGGTDNTIINQIKNMLKKGK